MHNTPSLSTLLTLFLAGSVSADAPYTAAAFTPDGQQVLLGSQFGIERQSWPDLARVGQVPTELRHVHDLKFSPAGRVLLLAGGAPAEVGVVEVLNWPDVMRIKRVVCHGDLVYRVAWSPDGTQWATAGADGICQTFDARTHEPIARYEGHSRAVLDLTYLPDDSAARGPTSARWTIASAGVDQTLRIWSALTGEHIRTFDNHVATVNALALRPSGPNRSAAMVATVSEDRTVRFWQPAIGRLVRFARLPSVPRVVAWSAKGDVMFVGCNDGQVRRIDPDTAEVLTESPGRVGRIQELLFEPRRGQLLIAGETGSEIARAASGE